jgi:3-hydroxyacyl-CoA dehydrogenase
MTAAWEDGLLSTAVLGAGGKMGSGIAWVVLNAMARLDARAGGVPGSGRFELVLIDSNRDAFARLRTYLRSQLVKTAEKSIGELREWAHDRSDLIENGEIIAAYVEGAMSLIRFDTEPMGAKNAGLVFEAVFENLKLKTELYASLKAHGRKDAYYLTNTSSIPISVLDKSAGLEGRILGFHFYNPPAVQKLVEMIAGPETRPELIALGKELGTAFGKIVVPSRDVAGFIGNGHFIRDGLFAMRKFRELRGGMGDAEAALFINRVTQDFLIRPMGIFQLVDYVGIDVFKMIMGVMGEHLGAEEFTDGTVDLLLAAGVKGGQLGSGEQKDGIFKYDRNRIAGVWDIGGNGYVSLPGNDRFAKISERLGPLPACHVPWNALSRERDPAKKEKLAVYFAGLAKADTAGAKLAREFLDHSRRVGIDLEQTGVAESQADVSRVLMNGFYHLYGPADWIHGMDKPRGAIGASGTSGEKA